MATPDLTPSTDPAVALAHLRSAQLPDDQEPVRTTILEFVADHADAAERSCAPGHLTGSALVVDDKGERTLLMLHAKLGRWFQPGGHADGNTNLAAVALAEGSEETGIEGLEVVVPAFDADIHLVPLPGEAPHRHLDLRFLVIAPADAQEIANHESLALHWVNEHELEALDPPVDESTRRLVVRGLTGARTLLEQRLS